MMNGFEFKIGSAFLLDEDGSQIDLGKVEEVKIELSPEQKQELEEQARFIRSSDDVTFRMSMGKRELSRLRRRTELWIKEAKTCKRLCNIFARTKRRRVRKKLLKRILAIHGWRFK